MNGGGHRPYPTPALPYPSWVPCRLDAPPATRGARLDRLATPKNPSIRHLATAHARACSGQPRAQGNACAHSGRIRPILFALRLLANEFDTRERTWPHAIQPLMWSCGYRGVMGSWGLACGFDFRDRDHRPGRAGRGLCAGSSAGSSPCHVPIMSFRHGF